MDETSDGKHKVQEADQGKMVSGLSYFSAAGFWPLTQSITVTAASARVEGNMRSGPVPSYRFLIMIA